MVEFYYHDNADTLENAQEDHNSGVPATVEALDKIGVLYYKLDDEADVDKLAVQRSYKNRDVVNLQPATFGGEAGLKAKLDIFYEEHLHEDEEIRYILDGEGFFDVRDKNDTWIRAKMTKGDLLILPAGIYHRFTLTTKNYVKALRLFKDEPKWLALNRPVDENTYRQEYLNSIGV